MPFYLKLSPQVPLLENELFKEAYTVHVSGSVITICGVSFDFTEMEDGSSLPSDSITPRYFVGNIAKNDGLINATVKFPHGYDAPHTAMFPEPIMVTEDGPVTLPDACWPPKEPEQQEYENDGN